MMQAGPHAIEQQTGIVILPSRKIGKRHAPQMTVG
jgi:hypothetical protein